MRIVRCDWKPTDPFALQEMEKFKAVEKEMKTKAFSKEGLNATAKLDPKEKEKMDMIEFLTHMVDELDRQVETLEAEEESLQATVKRGKKDTGKADRLSEITRTTERHKFHQGKLELLLRSLQNGNVETEQVQDLEESIRYYVEENQSVEFMEDDTIYDDLNLDEDEGVFGMATEADRVSSQDAQSTQDDQAETGENKAQPQATGKPKSTSVSEPNGSGTRRPSNAFKSTLPALATLHTPHGAPQPTSVSNAMKPAPVPTRPPGETLKYASAAAAAAASDKSSAIGIAPLPTPPTSTTGPVPNSTISHSSQSSIHKPGPSHSPNSIPTNSTATAPSSTTKSTTPQTTKEEPLNPQSYTPGSTAETSMEQSESRESSQPTAPSTSIPARPPSNPKAPPSRRDSLETSTALPPNHVITSPTPESQPPLPQTNGEASRQDDPEPIYHLPPGLQDLVQSFDLTKNRASESDLGSLQKILQVSAASRPSPFDSEKPRHYRPDNKYSTPDYYPQEPFNSIDDPALYSKIDTDTLFYIFYYRQNTFQQYMAAKSLKSQSWRFHKQYQTWFQRHEEPKTITEEYEQGTYRFFDYESTW